MEENKNTSVIENEETTEEITFTDAQKAEIAKLIQSESDRRTNQALSKQKKEYEKKISLAGLDGVERERAENKNRIEELESQLAAYAIEKNKSELKSVLSSRGLSAEFADIINISDDLEEAQQNIDKLDRLFKFAVKAEVEKRLAGNSPKGNGTATQELTKEQAMKLPMAELQKLAKEQPEVFKKLFN